MVKINAGKSYFYNNEKAFPSDMNGARVFVESFSSDNSSISYSYVKSGGHTGSGSMRLDHAEKHFDNIAPEKVGELAPGNKIKKGSKVKVISRPEGQTSSLADVSIGDKGIVQYIDGCCLCVKTDKDEFTANAARFELIS